MYYLQGHYKTLQGAVLLFFKKGVLTTDVFTSPEEILKETFHFSRCWLRLKK